MTAFISTSLALLTAAFGADWDGSTSNDWNTAANWNPDGVPNGVDAVINILGGGNPPFTATISADPINTPRDIIVGINGGNTGRVFHVSGTATTGTGNWLAIGVVGGTGTYNLTNTTATGGNISGFGQGSGTVSTSDRIIVGEQGGNGTLNINTTGSASSTSDIHVGNGLGSVGTVNLASGTLNGGNSGWFLLGTGGGQGTLNMTGGAVHIARETLVGSDANTVASLNIRGGSYSTGESGNLTALIGRTGGTGNLNVADTVTTGGAATGMGTGSGSFSQNGDLVIGVDPGSLGTARINTTGTVTVTGNIQLGDNFGGGGGTGRWFMDYGTVTAGNETWIGNNGGNGTMTISGGTYNAPNWVAVGRFGGTGVLTINGSGVLQKTNTNGSLEITNAGSTTASGTVNLDGGNLIVNQVTGSGGIGSTSILNFNGGTLKPTINNPDFINGNVVAIVKAGGAIIDTNGKTITINQSLTGDAANRLLTKNGTGTLTLGGAGDNANLGATVNADTLILGKTSSGSVHALGGATTVAGGTLQLGGTGGDQIYTGVTVTVNSGTFDLNGRDEGFDALAGSGGTVTNTSATTSTMTVGESGGSSTYAGAISNGAGAVVLIKTGAGTQTLTGNNPFTGGTTINQGTLSAAAAGALGGTSGITVNSGGTLLLGANNANRINDSASVTIAGGGIFDTGGLNEGPAGGAAGSSAAMGALTLSANSTIDFTNGTGSNLLFASLNYTPGATVSILNWTGMIRSDNSSISNDRLLFATAPGFSDAQLASIQFYNDSGVAFATGATVLPFNGYSELVPVPEPAPIFGAVALFGLAAFRERKRLAGLFARKR